jgi:alkylated DNA repair dioxygenase AlkB
MPKTCEKPEGLRHIPEFLSNDEERAVVSEIEKLTFQEVRMHGVVARRTVVHFGWDYDYSGWKIFPTTPPPDWLVALRDRAAHAAGIDPNQFEQFLIARYPPGASIGCHRDAPMFGSPVRRLAPLPLPDAISHRRVSALRPAARAAISLHPRWRRAQRVAASHPADQRAALLDHHAHRPSETMNVFGTPCARWRPRAH